MPNLAYDGVIQMLEALIENFRSMEESVDHKATVNLAHPQAGQDVFLVTMEIEGEESRVLGYLSSLNLEKIHELIDGNFFPSGLLANHAVTASWTIIMDRVVFEIRNTGLKVLGTFTAQRLLCLD